MADYLLCQEMKIKAFPTLRVYGPGVGAMGRDIHRGGSRDAPLDVLEAVLGALYIHHPQTTTEQRE